MRQLSRRSSPGFTLIETLAALLVFSLVTVGLVPLVMSTLRGPNLSRSYTIGKNLAVEAMERVRGLPFYIARSAKARDVDVLDLYYPLYDASGTVTTLCDGGARDADEPACPRDIPSEYDVRFAASFVGADGQSVVLPPPTYNSATVGSDEPPTQLLRIEVTVLWRMFDRPRQYSLESLVGARTSDLAVRGVALVNYGVKVSTSYRGTEGHSLTVTVGDSESRTETRSASVADQAVRAARLELVNTTDPTAPTQLLEGAVEILHAPPDTTSVTDVFADSQTLLLLGLGDVAGVEQTVVGEPSPEGDLAVSVSGEAPAAKGGFDYRAGAADLDGQLDMWVDLPHASREGDGEDDEDDDCDLPPAQCLRLIPGEKLVQMRQRAGETLSGWTAAETGELGGFDRGVRTRAHVEFQELGLFPTTFAGGPLVLIEDFEADVDCEATANAFTADATASWSGTLRYWRADPTTGAAGYSAPVILEGPTSADPLDGIGNPLVFKDPDTENQVAGSSPFDLYLFPQEHQHDTGRVDDVGVPIVVDHDHGGYLEDWDSLTAPSAQDDAQRGRAVSANITGGVGGALRILSDELPPRPGSGYESSALTVLIGSLECSAQDER